MRDVVQFEYMATVLVLERNVLIQNLNGFEIIRAVLSVESNNEFVPLLA
jgi:hypothetical protein